TLFTMSTFGIWAKGWSRQFRSITTRTTTLTTLPLRVGEATDTCCS
ncbi:homoserine O-succinyltransferase family protein, partial [Vibrio parahaemolyticus V-223/04]